MITPLPRKERSIDFAVIDLQGDRMILRVSLHPDYAGLPYSKKVKLFEMQAKAFQIGFGSNLTMIWPNVPPLVTRRHGLRKRSR